MTSQLSENEIIKGCKKGKEKYQEMLYRNFYGYGMSISLRYSSSKDEAVEILNDSFIKVFDSIQKIDESLPFKPWIRKIIINTAIDYYRKNLKYNNTIDSLEFQKEENNPEVIDKLNVQDILKLLNQLPENYRIIFNLYEIEGYTHDEIAEILEIAPGTSRANLSRAKNLLRLTYQKYFSECYEEIV